MAKTKSQRLKNGLLVFFIVLSISYVFWNWAISFEEAGQVVGVQQELIIDAISPTATPEPDLDPNAEPIATPELWEIQE